MRQLQLLLLVLWVSFALQACLGGASDEEVHTHYRVNLEDIDTRLQLDSAKIAVYVGGSLHDTLSFTGAALSGRSLDLPAIVGAPGDSVRIVYTVWAAGVPVAQGVDAFVPGAALDYSTASLQLDDAAIAVLLQSSSSAEGSSSSAEPPITAGCNGSTALSVGFLTNVATLREGSASVRLVLGGAQGAQLAAPQTIMLKVSSGADDVTLPTEVILPAGLKACAEHVVTVQVKEDLLVEGRESASLVISNLGTLAAGEIQSMDLTLEDGDSAWVEIVATSLPDSVAEALADTAIIAVAELFTRNAAKLAQSVTVNLAGAPQVRASSLGAAATFAAGSGSGSKTPLTMLLPANNFWEPLDSAYLSVMVASGPAEAKPTLRKVLIKDNDFEYLVMQRLGGEQLFFDPLGRLVGSRNGGVTLGTGSRVTALGRDTLLIWNGSKLFVGDLKLTTQPFKELTLQGFTLTGVILYDMQASAGAASGSRYRVHFLMSGGSVFADCDFASGTMKFVANSGKSPAIGAVDLRPEKSDGGFLLLDGTTLREALVPLAGSAVTLNTYGILSSGVSGGLAISASGVLLTANTNGLFANGERIVPEGVTVANIRRVIATARNTFWLVILGDTVLDAALVEIAADGTVLRKSPGFDFLSTQLLGVTYMRASQAL